MSSNTVVEWLNENALRAYPMLENSSRYISSGIVQVDLYALVLDASIVSSNVSDTSIVGMNTNSNNLTIQVSDQPDFVLSNYTTATYPAYIRNSTHSLLVVGDATNIPTNLSFNINAELEACVVTEIYDATKGLSSLTLAGQTLTGDISLSDGYQLTLLPTTHTINLEAGRNEGHPLPCIPILGTTNDCDTVASFVNGASPSKSGDTIKFVAGQHVKIYDDPDNHRIYIGYDFGTEEIASKVTAHSVSTIINSLLE